MDSVRPSFGAESFLCPHCGVHAAQEWQEPIGFGERCVHIADLKRAVCLKCGKYSIWCARRMVHPNRITVAEPN